MNCPSCGSEVEAGKNYCTNCGARLGGSISVKRQPAAGPPAAVASPPVGAPKTANSKTVMVIAIVVVALLVLGGAVGIIIWLAGGARLEAEILKLELKLAGGEKLDLRYVPLGKGLELKVTYRSWFEKGCKGKLVMRLRDGNDKEVRTWSHDVKPGDNAQTHTEPYRMTMSEGETFTVTAQLKVTSGNKSIEDTADLEYYVEKGEAGSQSDPDLQECRANMLSIRVLLFVFHSTRGNFPNDMSELADLPKCPSGGTYTYQADLSTDPPGVQVSCSVHGDL